MEIQLQELQINGNYGQKHCGAMDIYVLKSLWKMWITTCRRILLLFLCQLMAGRKTIKNQNNEKIRIRFETGWGGDYDLKDDFVEFELGDDPTKEHVRHLTITEDMMMINGHGLKEMNLAIRVRDENDRPIHVQVTKLILITPTALNL